MSGEDVTLNFKATGTNEIIADIGRMSAAVNRFAKDVQNSVRMAPTMTTGDALGRKNMVTPPTDYLPNLDKVMGNFVSPILKNQMVKTPDRTELNGATQSMYYLKDLTGKTLAQLQATFDKQGTLTLSKWDSFIGRHNYGKTLMKDVIEQYPEAKVIAGNSWTVKGKTEMDKVAKEFEMKPLSSTSWGNKVAPTPERTNLDRLISGLEPLIKLTTPWAEKKVDDEAKWKYKQEEAQTDWTSQQTNWGSKVDDEAKWKYKQEEAQTAWNSRPPDDEAKWKYKQEEAQIKPDIEVDWFEDQLKAQEKLDKQLQKTTRGSLLFFGLGIMFAGMALQKAAQGFLQPALEASGVMEIFGAALTLLFLPAALLLIPLAVWFLEEVSKMSPELKMVIGGIVLFAFALGGLMMIIGQMGTLIASMMQAPTVFAAATKFFEKLVDGSMVDGMSANTKSFGLMVIALVALAIAIEAWLILIKGYEDRLKNKPETASPLSPIEEAMPWGTGKAPAELRSGLVEWFASMKISDKDIQNAMLASVVLSGGLTAPIVAGNLAMTGGKLLDQQYADAQDAALKQGNITRENFLKGAGVLYTYTPEGVMWNADALKDFSGMNTKINIPDYTVTHPDYGRTFEVPTSQIAGYAGNLSGTTGTGANLNGAIDLNVNVTGDYSPSPLKPKVDFVSIGDGDIFRVKALGV